MWWSLQGVNSLFSLFTLPSPPLPPARDQPMRLHQETSRSDPSKFPSLRDSTALLLSSLYSLDGRFLSSYRWEICVGKNFKK
jgi:hypothetical protein